MKLFSGKKLNCLIAVVILAGVFLPIFSFAQTATTATGTTAAAATPGGEDQNMKFGALGWLAKWIVYPLLRLLIIIMRIFVEISGRILNWVLSPDFNRLPLTYGGIVDVGWKVLRDFANMFIVLILIVIGFATILKIETYGIKKLLPKLVLVALLINFSKVIAGAVVDASQIFMLYFLTPIHEATKDSGGAVINLFRGAQLDALLTTLPEAMSESTHVSEGIYKTASAAFVVVFLALAAVAFFYLAIILVTRIIYIWILVIVSPLAWAASIIPQGQTYWKKWWTKFLRECFLGVVIAFFVWMAIYLASMLYAIRQGVAADDPLSRGINSVRNESITYNGGNMMFGDMSLLLIYVVVIAFLYIAVHIARTQSNDLAKFAIKQTTAMGQKLMGMAGGLARGGARAGLQGVRRRMQDKVGDPEWINAHPRWSKVLGIVPGLGLGARMGAKIEAGKEVNEQKRLLIDANILPGQLAQIAEGTAITKEARRRKAAAIELIAGKGLLTAPGGVGLIAPSGPGRTAGQVADEGRKLAEALKRLGGNVNEIFKTRPDWIDTSKPGKADAIKDFMRFLKGTDAANISSEALDSDDVLKSLNISHWNVIKSQGNVNLINKVLGKLEHMNNPNINPGVSSQVIQNLLHDRGYLVDTTTMAPAFSNPTIPGRNVRITFTDRSGRQATEEL